MVRRLFTIAAAVSLLLCITTVTLWAWTSQRAHDMEVHGGRDGHLSLYARYRSLGWKSVGPRGVRGWDFDYLSLVLLTAAIPVAWAWSQPLRRTGIAVAAPRTEISVLRGQIRFLLPNIVAMGMMLGVAALAIDARQASVWLFVGPLEATLILNIVARQRYKTRLNRLLIGQCTACGYNLTGNTSGTCPECGTPVPSKPEGIA